MKTMLHTFGRRMWRPVGVVAIVASALVIAGAVPHMTATSPLAPALAPPAVAPATTTSYADVVSKATPAVVTVRIERKAEVTPSAFDDDPFFQRFFGQGRMPRGGQAPVERGLGSGVIVSEDGNILTNNHVVGGADHVTVSLNDGREFTAKVLGTDPATDLAVVHIDATNLPTLPLGDSDRVRVGDVVLAIGNPLGVGQTVTMGIVSAKGRTTDMSGGSYEDFLQTDAPINQGNSGGALITAAGELVGINSQILSNNNGGSIGIGFAIPSNMARNVANQLATSGKVRRSVIGVTIQPMTSDLAKSLGLSTVSGALVNSVEPSGPAAKSGLKAGDVILELNGSAIEDSNQLRNRVSALAPGTAVNLTVFNQGARRQVSVTLGELPDAEKSTRNDATTKDELGMTLSALTPNLTQQFRLPRTAEGVVVTEVDSSGSAARAGIQAGDVFKQIDGHAMKTAGDVRDALTAKRDRPALALVQRADHSFFVPLG
ncbi:MAG: DegQ family serine endoprotease [Acidobacteriota bacterium]